MDEEVPEKTILSSFCNTSLKCKLMEESTREKLKPKKEQIKILRDELFSLLKEDEILVIPQNIRQKINNELLKSGKKEIPPYIRKVKNNKDNAITNEIIRECVEKLNPDDILESQEEEGPDALLESIMQNLRRNVRTYTEQIKISDSVPRGVKAADVPFADAQLSEKAFTFHDALMDILLSESEKREKIRDVKEQLNRKKGDVDKFFEKNNINSQRVILEGCPYNLVRRVTVSKPKLTMKLTENIISKAIQELITEKTKTVIDKETIRDHFTELKDPLINVINSHILSLPSTTKSDIYLKRVSQK